MDIIVTIGGLAIGMILGGVILYTIVKGAKKKCDASFLEDEKTWEEVELPEKPDDEISEKPEEETSEK